MSKKEVLDYLPEDPPISGCKYGLISIVGPHMRQKCDVWGLNIRGYANELSEAKRKVKRLLQLNKHFDVYVVEIGKFFPLTVDPMKVDNIEYQNEQLNQLIKTYLENREQALDEFNERKETLMKKVYKEGQEHKEDASLAQKEHPVAVLKRKNDLESKLKDLYDQIQDTKNSIQKTEKKYEEYTDTEKEEAEQVLLKAISDQTENLESTEDLTPEQIRKELMLELQNENKEENECKDIELILKELHLIDALILQTDDTDKLQELNKRKETSKKNLHKFPAEKIQKFINNSWTNSKYDQLFD